MPFNVKAAGTIIGTADDWDSLDEAGQQYMGFMPTKGIFPAHLEDKIWCIAIFFEDGKIDFYDEEGEVAYSGTFKFILES